MKVLIAGATGAIGKPLLSYLGDGGHERFALVRSAKTNGEIAAKGAEAIVADAAVRHVKPDVIINELTALPKHYTPEEMKAAAPRDKEVRVKGNANLLAAARAANCRRYVLQSSAFWYAPGPGLADETASFAFEASPGIADGCRTYADLESAVQESGLQAIILRYGFFYGPATWFALEGDVGEQVRRREVPVIGEGAGIWNWVHIDDAAAATCVALKAEVGIYNVVDSQPIAQSVWLPAFANSLGRRSRQPSQKSKPLRVQGRMPFTMQPNFAELQTRKQKAQLAFRPRPLQWLSANVSASA